MERRSVLRLAAGIPISGLIAGCAGGGATVSRNAPSTVPTQAAIVQTQYAKVVLSLTIPRSGKGIGKRLQYVGAGTSYFTVAVDSGTPSTFSCTVTSSTCSGSVSVLPGTHTFAVKTFDSANKLLATNAPTGSGQSASVVANQQNNVAINMRGVVAKVAPLVACAQQNNFANDVPLAFLDADGNAVTGTFATPITVSMTGGYSSTVGMGSPIADATQGAAAKLHIDSSFNAFGVATTLSAIPSSSANGLPATIATGPLNYRDQLAFVTNRAAGVVSVVDVANNVSCGDIKLTGTNTPAPEGIAITPNGSRLFVVDNANNQLDVIDLTTYAIQNVAVGSSPHGVAYVTTGYSAVAFVTNGGGNSVSGLTNAASCTIGSCSTPLLATGTYSSPFGIAAALNGCCNFVFYVANSSGNSFTSGSGYLGGFPSGMSSSTTPLAVDPNFQPYSLALNSGNSNLYLLGETSTSGPRMGMIAQSIGGNGYFYALGAGPLAQPRSPRGIAVGGNAVFAAAGTALKSLSCNAGIAAMMSVAPGTFAEASAAGVSVASGAGNSAIGLDASSGVVNAFGTFPSVANSATLAAGVNSVAVGPNGATSNGQGAQRQVKTAIPSC